MVLSRTKFLSIAIAALFQGLLAGRAPASDTPVEINREL